MPAQSKVHLRTGRSGTRSPCRYSSRPSRQVRLLSIQDFADQPMALRCSECETAYRRMCADIQAAAAYRPAAQAQGGA